MFWRASEYSLSTRMQAPSVGERQWLPLESNPDVVSTFAHRMGASPLWKVIVFPFWYLFNTSLTPFPDYRIIANALQKARRVLWKHLR